MPDTPRLDRRSLIKRTIALGVGPAGLSWGNRQQAQACSKSSFSRKDYMRDLLDDLRLQLGNNYTRQYEYYNSPWDFQYHAEKLAYEQETGQLTTDCSEFISAALNRCNQKHGIVLDPNNPTVWYGTYNQRQHDYAPKLDIPEGITMAEIGQLSLRQGDLIYVTNMEAPDPGGQVTLNEDLEGRLTNFWGEHMMMVTGHDDDGNVKIIEATADPNGDGNKNDGCVIEHAIPKEKYNGHYRIDQIKRLSTRLNEIEKNLQAQCDQSQNF